MITIKNSDQYMGIYNLTVFLLKIKIVKPEQFNDMYDGFFFDNIDYAPYNHYDNEDYEDDEDDEEYV